MSHLATEGVDVSPPHSPPDVVTEDVFSALSDAEPSPGLYGVPVKCP